MTARKSLASPALDHRGIVVGADPRSITRAEALTDSILRRKSRIAEEFYDLGLELTQLKVKKLYRKVYGFTTFSDFLEARDLYSPTQARKLMRIAQSVTRERAIKLGVEKAYAAAMLAKATPEDDTAEEIFAKGRKIAGKKPATATSREIIAETKKERAKTKLANKSPKKVPAKLSAKQLAKLETEAQKIVRAALSKLGLTDATITLKHDTVRIEFARAQLAPVASK